MRSAGRVLDLWRCPICGDAWTAHGGDAHCAGSATEGTRHESVACLRVKALVTDGMLVEPIDYVREAIDAVVEAKNRARGSEAVPQLEAASESLARAESTLEEEGDDE